MKSKDFKFKSTMTFNPLSDERKQKVILHKTLDNALIHLYKHGFTKLVVDKMNNVNEKEWVISFELENDDTHYAFIKPYCGGVE